MKFYTIAPKPYLKLKTFATLIDYGIFFALYAIFIYSFGEKTQDNTWELNGSLVLIIPLFWFLYFVVLESANQATPGHDICKLRVYKMDGSKVSLSDAFKRRICDLVDFGLWGIAAFICVSKTPKHQRLGDLFANTIVAKASDVTEKEVVF